MELKRCTSRDNETLCCYLLDKQPTSSPEAERKLQNTTAYIRRVNCLTLPKQEEYFYDYLEEIEEMGYTIIKEGARILILTPYYRHLIDHFYSPIFVDGTFSCDRKTIIHAACVTTTNTIILIGLVICDSESADCVYFLLDNLKCSSKPTFVTDEGKSMLKAIKMMGDRCSHMLCTWHLAKQLPKVSKHKLQTNYNIRSLFYGSARSTTSSFKEFSSSLDPTSELRRKFESIKEKWCREYSENLRRDYIVNLSESLNGAVKKIVDKRRCVPLVKAFLHQSLKAYNSCVLVAKRLTERKFMPLAQRYYDTDIEISKSFSYECKSEHYVVQYEGVVVAKVKLVNDHYICSCNQETDLGTPCAHILCIEKVPLENYCHPMWLVDNFKKAFPFVSPSLPYVPRRKNCQLTKNKDKLISILSGLKDISDDTFEKIVAILGQVATTKTSE